MNISIRSIHHRYHMRCSAFGLKHGTLVKGALCHSLWSPEIFIDCSDTVLPSADLFIGRDSVHIKHGILYKAQSVWINSFLASRSRAIFVIQLCLSENVPQKLHCKVANRAALAFNLSELLLWNVLDSSNGRRCNIVLVVWPRRRRSARRKRF